MNSTADIKSRLIDALFLPEGSTDQEVLDEVKNLVEDNSKLRRRVVEEGTDLYQELSAARREIQELARRLTDMKQNNPGQ